MAESGGSRSPEGGTEDDKDNIAKIAGDVKGITQSTQSGLQEGGKKTDQANQKPRGVASRERRKLPNTPGEDGEPTDAFQKEEEKKFTHNPGNKNASPKTASRKYVSDKRSNFEKTASSNSTDLKNYEQVSKSQGQKTFMGKEVHITSEKGLVREQGKTDAAPDKLKTARDAFGNQSDEMDDSFVLVKKQDVPNLTNQNPGEKNREETTKNTEAALKEEESAQKHSEGQNKCKSNFDTASPKPSERNDSHDIVMKKNIIDEPTGGQLSPAGSDGGTNQENATVSDEEGTQYFMNNLREDGSNIEGEEEGADNLKGVLTLSERKETDAETKEIIRGTDTTDVATSEAVEDAGSWKGIATSGGQNKTETKTEEISKETDATDDASSEAEHEDSLEQTDKSEEQKETETLAEHNNDRETDISDVDDAPPKTAEHVGRFEGTVTSSRQRVTQETQAGESHKSLEINEHSLSETGQVDHVEDSETSSVLKEKEMQPDPSCSETVNKNHVHSEGSSSSIEQLAHGPDSDKEGTEIESGEHALLHFQMSSMTHLPENAESSMKCDKTLAFQEQHSELHSNDTRDTDKPGNSSDEAEESNTCEPRDLKKTKLGGSDKRSMSVKNYSLKKVGRDYLLFSENHKPVKMDILKGETNVTLEEDNLILINDEVKYYFTDEEGDITVHEIGEARSDKKSNSSGRKEPKEKHQDSLFQTTSYEKKEEKLSTEVGKKTGSSLKVRATNPQSDELLTGPNNQSSQGSDSHEAGDMDTVTDMVSKMSINDSETNSEGPSESTQTQTDIFPGRSGSKDTTKIPKPTPRKQTHDGREPCQGQSSQPVRPPRRPRGNDKHQSLHGNKLKSEGQDVHEEAETRKQEMKAENLVLQQLDVSGGLKEEERSPETESEMESWLKDIVFKVNYRLANTSEVQEKLITRKISHLDYMKWQLVVCDSHLVKTKLKKLKPEPAYSVTNSNKITEVNLDHVKECPPFENIIDALFHHLIADTQNLVCERVDFSTDLDSEAVLREITDIQFCKDKVVYLEICEKVPCICFICDKDLANEMEVKVNEVIQQQLAMSKNHTESVKRPMVFLKKIQQLSFRKDWNEKFPSIKYRGNTGENEAVITLQGPKKDLETAAQYIFEYPCNEISVSEVKHADCLNRSTLIRLLNYKLSSISEKYEDFAYEINEQTNRIGVCSPSQETAGSVTQNLKKCIKKRSISRKEDEGQFDAQLVETLNNGITENCKPYVEVVLGNKDAIDVYALKSHLEDCFEQLRARLESIKGQRGTCASLGMSALGKVFSSEAPDLVDHTVEINRPYVVDLICKSTMYDRFLKNGVVKITPFGQKGFHINGPKSEVEGMAHELEQFAQDTKVVTIDLEIKSDKNSVISEVIHEIERNMQVIVWKQEKEKTDQTPSDISGQIKVKWMFPQGHTVRLAQCCNIYEKKACVKLIEQNQGMSTDVGPQNYGDFPLLVPKWQEGTAKEKTTVQERFEKVLERCFNQSFHHVDIHICNLSWKIGLFVKQLLAPLKKVLADKKPCICVCFIGEEQQLREEIQRACREAFCGVSEAAGFSGQKHSETRDRLSVKVVKGNLVETKADVLVNTISTNGNLKEGAVSGSILREAGKKLQDELNKHTPLQLWGIYQTSAYLQGCTNILHGCLAEYKNKGDSTQRLEDFVSTCLSKAEECGAKSIAFPAIGSGAKKYPSEVVKNAMFNAVEKFGSTQRKQKTLTEVNFVIFEEEQYKMFRTEQQRRAFEDVTNSFHFGRMSLNAINGSIIDCDKNCILYLWEKKVMHTAPLKKHSLLKELDTSELKQWTDHRQGKDKDQLFWTTVLRGENTRQIVHVPYGNGLRTFEDAVCEGLSAVMSKNRKSVAIYLDKGYPCVLYTDFIQKILSGVLSASSSVAIEHPVDVTVVVEDQAVFSQIKHFFATNSQEASTGQYSSGKDQSLATGNVLLELVGVQRDISAAVDKIRKQEGVLLVEVQCFEADVFNRAQTECEVKSDDESVSESPGLTGMPPTEEKSDMLEAVTDLEMFVEMQNIPANETIDSLKVKLFDLHLPIVTPEVVFCDGSDKAIIICSSVQDAVSLSKYDKTQFRFRRLKNQGLSNFKLNVTGEDLKKLEIQRKETFLQELRNLNAEINKEENGITVCVKTSYQMKCVISLKKQLLKTDSDHPEVENITTTEDDGYEHIDFGILNVEGVTDQMWQLLQEERKEKIEEFKKCGGTITHNGNLLTLRRQEVLAGDDIMIKDYVSVFSSFVQQMKDMDFVEISIDDEHVANISMWKNEIEDKLNKRCCTFLEKQKMIIVYSDSYEEMKQIEHLFLVKLGKRKQTARSRKVATADDYSGPASLQSDYKRNQIMFEWKKDARNMKAYKTEEGLQVYVYEADILNLPVDCIVNAANDTLQHGGGVAQVIAKAAGRELTKEGDIYIRKYGRIPVGDVVTTTAGSLPYHSVIHAVGPRWTDYKKTDNCIGECEKDLFNAIYNSCVEADRKGFQSIAFPAISSAIFGVPGDLCVSQYVKATLAISKTKLASLKEIHFIDKNSDIVKQIQREFKTVLVDGKESPYQRQSYVKGNRRNRTEWIKSSDQAVPFTYQKYGHEVPENLRTVPTIQNKGAYFFEENGTVVYMVGKDETKRLLVYKGDLLEVKTAAIVVTVDENGTGGVLAKGVASKIQKVKMFDIYQKELKWQLSRKPSVGQIAITKGYTTHFSHVFHIIFPFGERLKQPVERRKRLTQTYKNVLSAAVKEKSLNIVATALVGIDGKIIEDIDLACSALWDAYLWHLQKLETESISPLDVHLVCLDENQLKRVRSNFNSCIEMIQNTEPETEDHQTSMKRNTEMSKDQDCVICMEQTENPKVLRCGHVFCTACIDTYFEIKKACPTCGAVCGIITGDQPHGDMKYYVSPYHHCSGYERCGQIVITYTFLSGRQEQTHPNPGAWYEGITRTAYLPDNEEGRKILKMLIVAFRRKLVFTIGRSRTTGKEGVITWNDIHHKTDWRSHSQFGYPDETYLQRVTEELAAKGVTEKDIVDVTL